MEVGKLGWHGNFDTGMEKNILSIPVSRNNDKLNSLRMYEKNVRTSVPYFILFLLLLRYLQKECHLSTMKALVDAIKDDVHAPSMFRYL